MARAGPHRILCVDDDALSRRSLKRALSAVPDVEIVEAESAMQARALLDAHAFSLVVTDHAMPGETGLDLLEHLAQTRPSIPSILVTAHTDLEVALAAVNRGRVYGLLNKPWQTEALVLAVHQALDRFELRANLDAKIAELEQANRRLEHVNALLATSRVELDRVWELATTDEKTGTKSYRYFVGRLEEEVARSMRYGHPLTLGLIDLDGFKQVNDRHGHVAGDAVLEAVARTLGRTVRVMDVLARFGGDEFGLVLPDTNADGARVLAERLRAAVARTAFAPALAGEITLSIGIASIPEHHAATSAALLELADGALYAAKAAGRNCFAVAEAPTSAH